LFAIISTISGVDLHKSPNDVRIPGKYVIKFKSSVSDLDLFNYAQYTMRSNITVEHFNIGGYFRGVIAELTSRQVLEHLVLDNTLEFLEEDRTVSLAQSCSRQTGAGWGLDRISERRQDLTSYDFDYPSSAGQGVTAYIVDTGVRITHTEFANGRATWGTNTDCNGHGTHVAGTVAGRVYGVAKNALIVAVKVLNCAGSGTLTGVINGLNWVAANARKPANANLSLGGSYSAAINQAVAAVVRSGVPVIVAAGNDNANACNYSPASEPLAITVGATDIGTGSTDIRSSFSNWGTCVDIFAPGSLITSSWHTSDTASNRISGTSMASPHVAGLVSLIQGKNPSWSVNNIVSQLAIDATAGVISNPGTGSPNRLGYSGNC
jgi:subtilisin family serine protease